jgi:translocation and assembly module TamB
MMKRAFRRRDVIALSTLAILMVGVAVVGAIAVMTQTGWGRARIRGALLAELRRAVHGSIYVGRLDGMLFTSFTLDSLEIRDRKGDLFLATGRVHVEYDPRDLLDRRILIQRLDLDHPVVRLVHHQDDSWNFTQIFGGGPRPATRRTTGFGNYIVGTYVSVHGGDIVYSNRWSPDDSLRGVRRERAIALAMSRPYNGIVRTSDGYARLMSWTGVNFDSLYVRVADPDSTGVGFRFKGFDADEFFPPFKWKNARGRIDIVHDSLKAALGHVELAEAGGGSVVVGGGSVYLGRRQPPRYNLHFIADSLSLADIAWVWPNLPRTGGGSAVVDIRSDRVAPEIMNYAVSNMDLRTTASRLRGSMTFEVGRPELIIKNVALDLEPVDFALIRALGGGAPFPIDWAGQWTGMVRGPGGPMSHFRVDTTDLTLADAHVPGATSRLAGAGELDIRQPALTAFHDFRLTIGRLDLRTPQYVLPAFPRLHGIIVGSATLDSVWNDVRFADASLTHIDGDGAPSRVTGAGRYTLGGTESTYDMALVASPIAFATLARSYPSLPVRAALSGPFSLQGTLSNLDLNAQLSGAPGGLSVDGHFDLTSPGRSGSGALILSHMNIVALLDRDALPETDLSMRVDADVSGDSLSGLDGPLSATISPSSIGRLVIDTGRVVGRFLVPRFRIDTLTIESPGGSLSARGGLALLAAARDSLRVAISADSLGGWRPYLPSDSSTDTTGRPALSGRVNLSAILTGWVDSLGASGSLAGTGMDMGLVRARQVSGTFDVPRLRSPAAGSVDVVVTGASVWKALLDTIGLHSSFMSDGRTLLAVRTTTPSGAHAASALEYRTSADTALLTLDTLAVYTHDNAWHLAAPVQMRLDSTGLTLDQLTMRGAVAGLFSAQATLPRVGPVTARVQVDSMPLADIAQFLGARTGYAGLATLDLRMTGDRTHPIIHGDGRLEEGHFGDVRLEGVVAQVSYADRRLDLHSDLLQEGDTTLHTLISLPVDLALEQRGRRLLDDSLRGDIRADSAGFGALATIYPALEEPKGKLMAAVNIGGTLKHPTLNGDIRLADGEAGFPRLGVRFVGMQANLHFAGDSLAVRDVTLNTVNGTRRGHAQLTGWVTYADLTNPRYSLTLTADELHAMSRPRLADVEISTEPGAPLRLFRLAGAAKDTLTGAIEVDRGSIYLPEMTQKSVVSLDDPELFRLVDTTLYENRTLIPPSSSSLMQNLVMDRVRVSFGSEVWLKSSEANINLTTSRGPLFVTTVSTGTGSDSAKGPALTGTLVAARGTFRLNLGIVQRTFTVDSGTVRFNGTLAINPDLNISALYVVRQGQSNGSGSTAPDIPIRVVLVGNLERDSIQLSSTDTVLTRSDLLSYLVTGQQAFTVGQNPSDAQNSLASFFLPTLGTALGSSLSGNGIVDVVTVQTASANSAAGQTGSLATALTSTRIGASKQIGSSTFVSADLGVCAGTATGAGAPGGGAVTATSQIGVRLEQQLTRTFSLAASSEPGTKAMYCSEGSLSRSFTTAPRQWGLDLFRTWQF